MPTAALVATQLTTPASPDLSLLIDQAHVIGTLADRSLSINVGSHGNSLGTLSATLNDPAPLPAVEQLIEAYTGLTRLYRGWLRVVDTTEYPGGHVFAALSAQDTGPLSGLPTAPPFHISDTPDGVTTKGYESLAMQTRTTEGGSAKTTARLVFREHGLWVGMNVNVTSANHGLSAQEFTIIEASVDWPRPGAPRYTFTLGDPIVKLAQIIFDGEMIPDGAITATKISDGAISTPKLAANAVTAAKIAAGTITATEIAANAITSAKFATDAEAPEVRNSTGYVLIDSAGVAVTNGAITVTNSGSTVIIDGTSNMFKIAASGTHSTSSFANPGSNTVQTTIATGFTYVPAHLSFMEFTTGTGAYATLYVTFDSAGHAVDWFETLVELVNTNETRVSSKVQSVRATGTSAARPFRYYVLKEAGI